MEQTYIDLHTQQIHLEKVSRTFALTIPFLPSNLVDYISNAYLLCRIADTIEDDPKAQVSSKVNWLNSFASFCHDNFSDDMQLLTLHKQALALTKDGAKKEEYALLEDMVSVIQRTRQYPETVKKILSKGVAILSFGMAKSVNGVCNKTLNDVDTYCYFVAGVVGELLADIFAYHDHKIDRLALMNLSVSFGEGLQLTNILKDRAEDATRGASFLPLNDGKEESLAKQGKEYIAYAQGHLEDALNFILLLPKSSNGIRMFCLLNTVMATATLKKIYNEDITGRKHVKITRNQVKFLYILCKICKGSNILTKALFKFVSLGVICTKRAPKELREKVSLWDKTTSFLQLNQKDDK